MCMCVQAATMAVCLYTVHFNHNTKFGPINDHRLFMNSVSLKLNMKIRYLIFTAMGKNSINLEVLY